MTVVFGASGHAKEIAYLLDCLNDEHPKIDFFVDDVQKKSISEVLILPESLLIEQLTSQNAVNCNAYIGVGDGVIRKKISEKFANYRNLIFPNLVALEASVKLSRISMKEGNIFFPGVKLTVDAEIGSHNHFNLGSTVSHDCVIGNFNTLSPGVRLAGNVTIGSNNFFGINACVIDKVRIADNVVIGAGAVVIKDLIEAGTYVGIPARRIK